MMEPRKPIQKRRVAGKVGGLLLILLLQAFSALSQTAMESEVVEQSSKLPASGTAADTLETSWREENAVASVQGAESQPVWSLERILTRIREDNPALQGYQYRAEAMDRYAEGARSWPAPMLGAGTFMTPYPGGGNRGGEAGGMFMIGAEQAIPNPAKLKAKEAYQESKSAIVLSEEKMAYNELKSQAKALYFSWLVLEKKKAVLAENQRIMETLLKLARIRYPYSQGSLGSIYKAEGRLHQVENELLQAGNASRKKNVLLNALMNIPDSTRFRIDTAQQLFPLPLPQDTGALLRERSDLERLDGKIASMELETELERLERKPSFSISFDHMLPYNGMVPNQYSLMGMISIPIAPWSSGSYKSSVKGKQLEVAALEKEKEALLNAASGRISGMTWDIRSLEEQLNNYDDKIIPALRRNYQSTLLSYEQNQEELPIVIDAWEALNTAQMAWLNTLESYYLKVVDYEKELEK